MTITNFKDLYYAELSELADAANRFAGTLAKAEGSARHEGVGEALAKLRDEVQAQGGRVRRLLENHHVDPDQHQDQAMRHLLDETEKMLGQLKPDVLAEAGIIASVQKILHYGIAAYGTVATYADVLGFDEEKGSLHTILDEHKAADTRLTLLAKTVVNADAARAA